MEEAAPRDRLFFVGGTMDVGSRRSARDEAGAERLLFAPIADCVRCKRLVDFRATFVSMESRTGNVDGYWAKPVPGFGDASGRLLVIGLAPGAHGANRTGRPFTGDWAGRVLYGALYRHGFCNQPESTHPNDGLRLDNVYITNAVECVPPANRPIGSENAPVWAG